MVVNNIPLAIGQQWKTRGGQEVEIVGNDGHSTYPWDLSNGFCVTNQGTVWEFQEDDYDLLTLIQEEHGFIPWNGGECPVSSNTLVEYKMRDYGDDVDVVAAKALRWNNSDSSTDIIAYRVVQQEAKPTKVDVEEEPKYTVEQVFEALDKVALIGELQSYMIAVKKTLDKTQDPEYNKYLELKAKFEKE